MSLRTKIARLPREVREALERLRTERGYNSKELLAYLQSCGAEVGIRAVRRHVNRLDQKMESCREAQEVASAWVAQLGKEPEGGVGRLLLTMLRIVALRHIADLGDPAAGEAAKPADMILIAKTITEMETASTAIADREIKLRAELRSELDRKVGAIKPDTAADSSRDIATLNKAKELVRGLL
jgi:uncharacterized protein DUF3486